MPGPWITDAELKAVLAPMLKLASPAELVSTWDPIVSDANRAAADDVTQILLGRGYSAAQIDAWSQAKTYNRDIGLFWTLVKGGGLDSYPDQGVNKLDRRKELATVLLVINGVAVAPNAPGATGAGAGGGLISEQGYSFNMGTEF